MKHNIYRSIVKLSLRLHNFFYHFGSRISIKAEGGIHPKHRLMKYHQFFVDNVNTGDTVLDVGCGNGALLRDVSLKTKAAAVGVDIVRANVKKAAEMLADQSNVEIVHADIWKYNNSMQFNAVMLSNVLEHVDRRVDLLKYLVHQYRPEKILIRVPMFERSWIVPYMKELDVDWRLDATHEIEYTEEQFRDELSEAGLKINSIIFRWGEMYTIATMEGLREF